MKALHALFFILMLSGIFSAETYYPVLDNVGEFTAWNTGWGALIVYAMLIVFFFYAIVYVLSFALQSEEMKKSAKGHIIDTIFTVLLAVMVISIMNMFFQYMQVEVLTGMSVTCDRFGTITLGDSGSPYDVIRCRLMEKASFLSVLYQNTIFSSRGAFEELLLNLLLNSVNKLKT
ncbi:hypothetical protein KJ780_01710, partial [Candidatus Micrarchaeota archaeon]|nr:hypothetical protein [Candidatus Micrarchaeota archaeon]